MSRVAPAVAGSSGWWNQRTVGSAKEAYQAFIHDLKEHKNVSECAVPCSIRLIVWTIHACAASIQQPPASYCTAAHMPAYSSPEMWCCITRLRSQFMLGKRPRDSGSLLLSVSSPLFLSFSWCVSHAATVQDCIGCLSSQDPLTTPMCPVRRSVPARAPGAVRERRRRRAGAEGTAHAAAAPGGAAAARRLQPVHLQPVPRRELAPHTPRKAGCLATPNPVFWEQYLAGHAPQVHAGAVPRFSGCESVEWINLP